MVINIFNVTIKKNLDTLIIPDHSTAHLIELQSRLDEAERQHTTPFADFTDIDIMQWFLYNSKHLDETRGRSERSTAAYKRELEQFCSYITLYSNEIGIDITEIQDYSLFKSLQPRHLRLYQKWLSEHSPYVKKKGNYSIATLERKTTILKMFFSYLFNIGYIKEPLHQQLKVVRVLKDDRPNRDMSPNDVVRVLDAFIKTKNIYMFTLTQVLVTTGIRNEELCRLKVSSVKRNLLGDGYYITVLGKGNKKRDIPLRDKVFQSIEIFRSMRGLPSLKEAKPTDPLFTTSTGKAYTPSYLVQVFNRELQNVADYLDQDLLNCTPHVFRHAFAIISHVNKVDIFDIMRSLGHEKIDTTMIYLEKIFEKEKHAINQWQSEHLGNLI